MFSPFIVNSTVPLLAKASADTDAGAMLSDGVFTDTDTDGIDVVVV